MHSEYCRITPEQAAIINETKKNGKRVIAVGTTSCRTLESRTGADGKVMPGSGQTGIYIYPGYDFKMTDGLITNFHLPESTLLMLVSAFGINLLHECNDFRKWAMGEFSRMVSKRKAWA
jgi:S-adenosylmethionine:tRNA ribosyltransferase-isomerase